MILPDNIAEIAIGLADGYFDLRGLSAYSDLAIPTLRDYIREGKLPCFKVKGKILIKRSEFDSWIEGFRVERKKNINKVVSEVLSSLKNN